MRATDAAAQAIRAQRKNIYEIPMMWISSRHRGTGSVEGVGLWRGGEVENINVLDLFTKTSAIRTFYNGALIEVGELRYESGFNYRPITVTISALNAAALTAFREYEPRGAQVQGWRRVYNPDTGKPVSVEPWFKGFVNEIPIERPGGGGEFTIELGVVSTAAMLTIASMRRKSDQEQRRRTGAACPGGDRIRKYTNTAAAWEVSWGDDSR
jgi:hypothetical protein